MTLLGKQDWRKKYIKSISVLAIALLGSLFTGCGVQEGPLNEGVDFLQRLPVPESSQIVEKSCGETIRHMGWFDAPFEKPNVQNSGGGLLWAKRWHYFYLSNDRYHVGLSVVNFGYISSSFLYVYDKQTDTFYDHSIKALPCFARMASNTIDSDSRFEIGRYRITIENDYPIHRIEFECGPDAERIIGSFEVTEQAAPLINVREVAPNRLVYTHQHSSCRVSGTLNIAGQPSVFSENSSVGVMDFTVGRQNYISNWLWAAGAGSATEGEDIAFNIALGSEENSGVVCFWVDNDLYRIADASITEQPDGDWRITSPDDALDLTFTPEGEKVEDVVIPGLLGVYFRQPFGNFRGSIRTPDGTQYTLGECYGITEDQQALW